MVKKVADPGRVYQDSWPDWDERPQPKVNARTKVAPPPLEPKTPGTYMNKTSGAWYRLSEEGRRRPVEGRLFTHPVLRRDVYCQEDTGLFLELDGRVVPELDGSVPPAAACGVRTCSPRGAPVETMVFEHPPDGVEDVDE